MRRFTRDNAEVLVTISLFAIFGVLKLATANQIAFLNLYFIPVLLAGYFLGKRQAILSAVGGVLLATLFLIRWPEELLSGQLYGGLNILVWASLLILSSILVSTLNESRMRQQAITTLKLLEKYVGDVAQRETHSARVGRLAREIAQELRLHPRLVSSVEAAGLLHDIADTPAGLDLIADCNRVPGGMSNSVIGEAIPILSRRHAIFSPSVTAVGPQVLAVADLYDTARGEDRNRQLLEIIQYIERETDETCTIVTKALVRVLHKQTA